jgi:hypothetical protein
MGTSTTALAATASAATTTSSIAAATSIVLPKSILETLAPVMVHARMERAQCIGVRADVKT